MAELGRDELEGLAGEYVLGVLDVEERRAAEARYAADPAFRAAVSAWERRLQPLAEAAGETPPHAGSLDRVMERIRDGGPPAAAAVAGAGENVVALRREVRRWRFATALAGAAAAALAAFVVVERLQPPQEEFVAVLTAGGDAPAFVATVNVADGTLSIRQVVDRPLEADHSYELWAIEPNATPVSLGVVDDGRLARPISYSADGLTLAVSLEPKGGSPTGQATGPILFVGQLVPAE